jgi:hypothetical protein
MSKSTRKSGQPILAQVLNLIPQTLISECVAKHKSNKGYRTLTARVHLISNLFGSLTFCNGLRELCEGLLGCEGKLIHLGLFKTPSRSTLSDANSKRSYLFFESLYFALLGMYQGCISDSRLKGLSIRNLKIIDSTTIRLFSDIMQGVGRNKLDGSRKKGGLKVHSMMDAFSGVVEFLNITEAKVHDRKFLLGLDLAKHSFIVFDKAYNVYSQFDKWTKEQIWFVTRMKDNAVYHVCKVLVDNTKKKNAKGLLKEQLVTVGYKDKDKNEIRVKLRRIEYKADDGRIYVFLTNNFKLSTKQIALIYKSRWMIELLFKQLKQNFPLKYFWSASDNGIKIQIYTVLIAQLLMVVCRKLSETKKSFANMITLIRLHIMSYVNLLEFVKDTFGTWSKKGADPINFSP